MYFFIFFSFYKMKIVYIIKFIITNISLKLELVSYFLIYIFHLKLKLLLKLINSIFKQSCDTVKKPNNHSNEE